MIKMYKKYIVNIRPPFTIFGGIEKQKNICYIFYTKMYKKYIVNIRPPLGGWVVFPSIFYAVKERVIHGLYQTEL